MGTDIHGVFQAKKNGYWVDIPSKFEEDRHYFLFAWLGNVRNGYGFAGVPTHTAITPLSDSRGLPSDFTVVYNEHPTTKDVIENSWRAKYRTADEPITIWMGDHSWSWLAAEEMLDPDKRPKGVLKTGIVSIEQFRNWDGKSQPDSWCGATAGPGILVSNPTEITDKTTHVVIEWFAASDELDYFVEEVRRLKQEHGEVRFVFGFDS